MNATEIDDLVRTADPLPHGAAERWAVSREAFAIRDATRVVAPAETEQARGRIARPGRLVAIVAVVLVVGAAAAGAVAILGRPAPPSVKRDIAQLDAGLPADIRLNPDVESARSVATTGRSTLYYAELRDGGFCTEIVTAGEVGRGANCTTGPQASSRPIEVSVPFTDPITPSSPVTIGGRVNVASASLAIVYADGTEHAIPFGTDHFFIFDVPAPKLAAVHSHAFDLVARSASGSEVAKASVPAVAPDSGLDADQPIFVSTISDGDDLTKVLGIEGSVNVEGAVRLELVFPDGSRVEVPLAADGSYRIDLPADRRDDLYERPGTLIARDGEGTEVARAPVAAVAFWRAQERAASQ